MNEQELKELWQKSHQKLEESLVISQQNTEAICQLKVQSLLASMNPIKIFTLLVGILWVGIGSVVLANLFVFAFDSSSKFFLVSAAIQLLLTAIAIGVYVYQLTTISQIDIAKPILKTQEKLAGLTTSTLWITRILFLQLPVWTTFWWNESMLQNWNFWQWAIAIIITCTFTLIALWLFFNIKFENRNKKWFRLIFKGKEWTPLMKAMGLLEQLKVYNQSKSY